MFDKWCLGRLFYMDSCSKPSCRSPRSWFPIRFRFVFCSCRTPIPKKPKFSSFKKNRNNIRNGSPFESQRPSSASRSQIDSLIGDYDSEIEVEKSPPLPPPVAVDKKNVVVKFNTPKDSKTDEEEDDGYSSSQSSVADPATASVANVEMRRIQKNERKRGIYSRCKKGSQIEGNRGMFGLRCEVLL